MKSKIWVARAILGGIWAATSLALAMVVAIPASGAEGKQTVLGLMDGHKPSGVLRTLDGKIFLDVTQPEPDDAGLTFRHAGGAARVLRERLSAADQKRFSLPDWTVAAAATRVAPPRIVSVSSQPPSLLVPPPVVLTYHFRTIFPAAPAPSLGCDYGCGSTLSRLYWPTHWSRPHYGMAYPIFPCRQAAERDFLITTGILPRPRGVQTWRLR
jgi:hypothetical protein